MKNVRKWEVDVRGDELENRLLEFAARVGKAVDALPNTRMGRHIAGQLIRCGTAAAPNYAEACAAESRADFVHKLMIALKELRESCCWIRLFTKAALLSQKQLSALLDENTQLCKILARSIVTAKTKSAQSR
jgi:four helix bundle protein